jgi:hypothetical protein
VGGGKAEKPSRTIFVLRSDEADTNRALPNKAPECSLIDLIVLYIHAPHLHVAHEQRPATHGLAA